MKMQAIKDQVAVEAFKERRNMDTQAVEIAAREIAKVAFDKARFHRVSGDTQSEIYNNTVDDMLKAGYNFEMVKVAVGWAVATR
jgi:hypothetical protein